MQFGTPAHELGHAIGLIHEQSREDRDNYLTINWENIMTGLESQFDMNFAPFHVDMGVRYDYGSIMQYTTNVSLYVTIWILQGVICQTGCMGLVNEPDACHVYTILL